MGVGGALEAGAPPAGGAGKGGRGGRFSRQRHEASPSSLSTRGPTYRVLSPFDLPYWGERSFTWQGRGDMALVWETGGLASGPQP